MKRKIIFAIATGFFAVATVVNMNMLQGTNIGDISLESIAVMAQAEESETGSTDSCSWVQYEMVFNPSTQKYENAIVWSCTATCTSPSRPDCSSFGCSCR